ncbi:MULTISPECIES: BON domain-containing protein [unclassified Pseudodesulfovibrio]|uniref:BON domain-containing protein n=1 Tax=unclassified Pseudodesulfovibrio TaxID=2661612 RepID=UPI000FEC0398|nr:MULTISPECIES: BON domain-containing protein [unclassified Pseudodesulfovibrio]MCJ2164598.1 BON domain-containing protein [Pseudodesulfovibrio sp. S3-i]RWU04208.1 BON domain-containing protein [Pseudodesulfovibrio sp. S3]
MFKFKLALVGLIIFLLPGCAAVPFGIGLIPGAPAYISSLIGGGQSVYETAMDERSTEQQMLDAIIAGHAQAELYKNKDIQADQITTHCYFGKLYLVGEYDSQEQLRTIYECMDRVEGKQAVISRLYLRDGTEEQDFFGEQARYTELKTQLLADFEVVSTPIEVEIVQGDIILLGVIAEKDERDRIMAHALGMDGINRVISYLYHQEYSGPEPHIMTAGLPPAPEPPPDIPPEPKKKPRKQTLRPKVQAEPAQPTQSILAVTNPDRGR